MNNNYCVIAHYYNTPLTNSVYVTGCSTGYQAARKAEREYFPKKMMGNSLKELQVLPQGAKRWDNVQPILVICIANQKTAA